MAPRYAAGIRHLTKLFRIGVNVSELAMAVASPGRALVGFSEPVLIALRARADFRADGGALGVDAGCLLLVERFAFLAGGAARPRSWR